MFEFYLENNLSYTSHRRWRAHSKANVVGLLDGDLLDSIVEEEGPHFQAMVWLALGNIGDAAILQLNYMTFMLKFKGCSRSGLKLTGSVGWTAKMTTFDKWVAAQSEAAHRTAQGWSSR